MHRARWMTVLCTAALLAPWTAAFGRAQEPAQPLPPTSPASPSPAASTSKPGKKKYSHTNDFLVRGTVFSDKALSAPGVRLRIRKAGEKKFRWESYTNSRGEFAVRVPQGSDYEMVVRAKGFVEQTRTINAKNGGNEESMVFRMQPAKGGKK
jgi:Carboxypeptidase regulatory-like domain